MHLRARSLPRNESSRPAPVAASDGFVARLARSTGLRPILVLVAGLATSAAASGLSPAERVIVARGIATLHDPGERRIASGWSEAKQSAEFICRPVALGVLRQRDKGADRVFLGIDPPHDLILRSDRLLTGAGSVRTPNGWHDFHFTCALDPVTGKVVSFQPR